MKEIYHAAWQGKKVRGFLWFALAVGIGCLYWGYDLYLHYGLSPGDGGVLRPLGQRIAWGGFVALFGLVLAGGMLVYAANYIDRIRLDEGARRVFFETILPWGSARFAVPPEAILGSRYSHGHLDTGVHTVNAPYFLVRVRGRKLPLILDGQGQMAAPGLAQRLLGL